MPNKKSFILHIDSLGILDSLNFEQAGRLFKAIKSYQDGEEIELDEVTKLIFFPFKSQFDRDQEKYENICKRNKNNGIKGGRPKTQDNPVGSNETQESPKNLKKDNDSDNGSDNKKKKNKRFAAPSIDELKAYVKEKNLNVGAETFINHYETNGWKVGKNKMVSWKHAAANWSKRNNEQNKDERESSEKKWQDTATGIREKGKEVGLRETDFYSFPIFKGAVEREVRRLENAR